MPIIDGYQVKELQCKNDNCRMIFGWENVRIGVLIFHCPRCKTNSLFKMSYSKTQETIDKIIDIKKGGEK